MTLVALRGFQPAPVPTLSTVQPEPPELREADLARIQHALTAAHAPSTLRTYASSWSQFERWCGERGYIPLPAHPATLCAYLTEQAEAGKSLDSLNGACSESVAAIGTMDCPAPPLSRRSAEYAADYAASTQATFDAPPTHSTSTTSNAS